METDTPLSGRRARVLTAILILILLAAFLTSTYFKHETYNDAYEVWGVFHYYLGAKYFSETGYFSLYSCALQADRESEGYWHRLWEVRDLRSYRIVPRISLSPCPRANFTPARWSEFSRDVEYFAQLAPPAYFGEVFTDKGFNAPPSWVAIAKPLAQAVPLSRKGLAMVLFNLDVAAVLIGIWLIWRSRSSVAAMVTAWLAIFYFGNFGRIGGNFLQYFWVPFLIIAVILWTRNRPASAGAMLGVATGLQIFPVFFGLPIVVLGLAKFFRERTKEEWRPHLIFSGSLVAVIFVAFLLGSMAGRGSAAWDEWQAKISIHKNYLQGEIFNMGLATLFSTAVSSDLNEGRHYLDDTPNSFARVAALGRNIWMFRALLAAFFALWVWTLLRAPAGDLFGHGFLIMFAAVNLSPYYYLSLSLLPFMFWESDRVLRRYATWGTIVLFATHLLYFRAKYISSWYWPHLLSLCSMALFLAGLSALSLLRYGTVRQSDFQKRALSAESGN